jgi:transposase, IS6 family
MYLYRAVDSEGSALEFLLSTTRYVKVVKRFFVKALYSTAYSAPQTHPNQEEETQPTTAADPNLTKSAPRDMKVDEHAAKPKPLRSSKALKCLPSR